MLSPVLITTASSMLSNLQVQGSFVYVARRTQEGRIMLNKRMVIVFGVLLGACASNADLENRPAEAWSDASGALASITAADILQHTRVLSADEFEGRGPGTRGEDLTVAYLTQQFQRLGLKPGNPDGTFVQNVPLVGF